MQATDCPFKKCLIHGKVGLYNISFLCSFALLSGHLIYLFYTLSKLCERILTGNPSQTPCSGEGSSPQRKARQSP